MFEGVGQGAERSVRTRMALLIFFLFLLVFSSLSFLPQTALVMAHVDMEESVSSLQSQRDDLAKKSEMCSVFESGLVELRTMLEKEIEKGQDIQKAWEDLSKLQKKSVAFMRARAVAVAAAADAPLLMYGTAFSLFSPSSPTDLAPCPPCAATS